MESVKKNYFYQIAYQVLTTILPLITSPYLARVIGAEGVGIYSYTYAVVNYFVITAKLGLHVYGNRCIATVRDDKEKLSQTFCDLYSLHAIISTLTIIVYIFFLEKKGGIYKEILYIQSLYLIAQLLDVNWFFFGIEKFKITVIRNACIKILTVASIFLFVKQKEDFVKYIFILAFGSALSESVVWLFLKKYIKFVKPNFTTYKKHIFPMMVFFLPSVAVSVYKMMDKIMLGIMSSTLQVGLYENSEKIITICLSFITALGTVMLPRMTNLAAKGQNKESIVVIKKSSKFVLIFSYAMCFGIIGISNTFPVVFWGNQFKSCGLLMMGLAISLPFTAIANVIRSQYLIPRHKDKEFVFAVCIGAVVNFISNLIFIPLFSAIGAVIGTIIAEIVVCLLQLIPAQKRIPVESYIHESTPFIIVGVVMTLIVYWIGLSLGNNIFSLIVQIIVGCLIYVTGSAFCLFITGDEVFMFYFYRLKGKKR